MVDGVPGITTLYGNVALTAPTLNINQPIYNNGFNGQLTVVADTLSIAGMVSMDTVNINTLSSNRPIDLGAGSSGGMTLTAADLANISANALNVTAGSSGSITVNGALTTGGALANVGDVTLNSPVITLSSGSTLAPNGNVTLTGGGTLNISGTASGSDVTVFATVINSLAGANLTGTSSVSVTTDTSPPATLAITAPAVNYALFNTGTLNTGALGQISASSRLTLSADSASTINVDAGVTRASGELILGAGTVNVSNALSNPGRGVSLSGNSMSITAPITAGSVEIVPFLGGPVTLGAAGGGLNLTSAQLNNINAGILTIGDSSQTGAITVNSVLDTSGGGALQNISSTLVLKGASFTNNAAINFSGKPVTVLANDMSLGAALAGSVVTLAPRASNQAVNLGTAGACGSALCLDQNEFNQVTASTILRIGSQADTLGGPITFTAPITINPALTPILSLYTQSGGISQSAGSIIAANNLRLSAATSVNLGEANQVGTLAGQSRSFSSFAFKNSSPLAIGSQDGLNGVNSSGSVTLTAPTITITQPVSSSSSTVTLNADDLDVSANVSSSGATNLLPTSAGRAINIGTAGACASALCLDASELGRFTTFSTLAVGNASSGPITITGPVTLPNGSLSFTSGGGFTANGTLAVPGSLTIITDMVAINAALTSNSTTTVRPLTAGLAIDVGTKTPGTLGFSAAEVTALNGNGSLILGDTSNTSSINISAPITHTGALTLRTAGAITDGNASGIDLTTNSLTLTASTGVGTGNPLETATSSLNVSTSTGNVEVANSSAALSLGGVSLQFSSTGSILLSNSGALTVNGTLSAPGGNVMLNASSITQNSSINVGGSGSVSLAASAGNITQNANINVTGSGGILVSAPAGSIGMSSVSSNTNGGPINYQANGNITVGLLNAKTGNVTVSSNTGSINDANGNWVNNVVAGNLTLNAVTGINLDTKVSDTQTVHNTGPGTVNLRDLNCVPMQATNQPVNVTDSLLALLLDQENLNNNSAVPQTGGRRRARQCS